jgi:hypothetical protein
MSIAASTPALSLFRSFAFNTHCAHTGRSLPDCAYLCPLSCPLNPPSCPPPPPFAHPGDELKAAQGEARQAHLDCDSGPIRHVPPDLTCWCPPPTPPPHPPGDELKEAQGEAREAAKEAKEVARDNQAVLRQVAQAEAAIAAAERDVQEVSDLCVCGGGGRPPGGLYCCDQCHWQGRCWLASDACRFVHSRTWLQHHKISRDVGGGVRCTGRLLS